MEITAPRYPWWFVSTVALSTYAMLFFIGIVGGNSITPEGVAVANRGMVVTGTLLVVMIIIRIGLWRRDRRV